MGGPVSRRTFLAGTAGLLAAACSSGDDAAPPPTTTPATVGPTTTRAPAAPPTTTAAVVPAPAADLLGAPFTLGVASGEPLADSVVLWTRLVPDPTDPDGGMPDELFEVAYDVALDETFTMVVDSGLAVADADYAHSVHVEPGGLEAATTYFYRFRIGDHVSPTGRTRTLPANGTEPWRFALTTCQDPQFGEYAAWADIAADPELDAVIFTGDYIYELPPLDFSPAGDGRRAWTNPPPADLAGFRLRYAQVKQDASLQAAHAALPFLTMWDDHEITDNYWADGPGQFDSAGGDFAARRAAAYQAWWEHQPARVPAPVDGTHTLYRSVRVGDLAEFFLIDTRQFADEPPCRETSAFDFGEGCAERDAPERTLLGDDQAAWLTDGIRSSTAHWTSLVSPSMFAGLDARDPGADEPRYYLEAWDGYPVERARVADALREAVNPIVLSGDYHASFVLDVGPGFGDDVICPEVMATAISSSPFATDYTANNPHVQYFAADNGYTKCTVTADEWRAEYRSIADIWDPTDPLTSVAEFAFPAR